MLHTLLVFSVQINQTNSSQFQVVFELHQDTLPWYPQPPFVQQKAHPAEDSLSLRARGQHEEHAELSLLLALQMFDQDWIKFWIWYISFRES